MADTLDTAAFRRGLKIEIDREPWEIVEFQHVKPGKGSAFVRTRIKNLLTGRTIDKTFKSGDVVGKPDLEEKEMQYLYREGDHYNFMDNKSYDQTFLTEEQMGEAKNFIKDNTTTHILFYNGKAIGVDMTPEMVTKANSLAKDKGYENVEFRLGEIEKLPVADSSVDTIMSNCVINLAPDKSRVFREAYRSLKPGGKIVISDIVSELPLPAAMQADLNAWSQCVSGALQKDEYIAKIREAGFRTPEILSERSFYVEAGPDNEMQRLFSVTVRADK